jgi:hypothetical protein
MVKMKLPKTACSWQAASARAIRKPSRTLSPQVAKNTVVDEQRQQQEERCEFQSE